jgi:hypothetical protein
MRSRLPSERLVVLATAFALTVALGACGDSDDGTKGADAPATTPAAQGTATDSTTTRGDGPRLTGDREQAAESAATVDRVYGGFDAAADAGVAAIDVPVGRTLTAAEDNPALERICDAMSRQAQRQTIDYAERGAGIAGVDWTCEKATGLLLRRVRQLGGLKRALQPRVTVVDADGDRATATVEFPGGRKSKIELVEEDGRWKLAASPGASR